MKHLLLFIALALLPACASEEAETVYEESETITEADLENWREARAYMSSGGGIWAEGLEIADLRTLVDDCYDAGSPRVMFAGIETIGDGEVSAWLVIELPTLQTERAAVIQAFNRLTGPYGLAATDQGQQFLDLTMD